MRGSVRFKLILLFIAVGLVPLVVSVGLSYFIYADNLLSITADVAKYNGEWAADNIGMFFRNAENSSVILESRSLGTFLRMPEDTPADAWELLSTFDLYESSLFRPEALQNISVLGLNGKCINLRDGYYRKDPGLLANLEAVAEILNKEGEESLLQPARTAGYRNHGIAVETMSLGRRIYDPATLEVLGVIILDFYPEEVDTFYRKVRGRVIGRMDLTYLPGAPAIRSYETERIRMSSLGDGLVVSTPILFRDWYLTYTISSDELREPIGSIIRFTLLVSGLSVFLIIFAFFFISNRILMPLKTLRTHMQEAAIGDFSTRFELLTDDEVLVGLRDSFNTMVFDLENLMKQKDLEHSNYLQAHLRMLQQQINPHFLYNTLDTIVWMTLEKRNEDVISLVESLSTFFRLNLSEGIDIISVADSILCLKSYLAIQKMRYTESLDYTFSVQPDILEAQVLKLILQPILENALYHGIHESGGGAISIEGRGEGDGIIFVVRDDGAGINPEALDLLTESINVIEDLNGENNPSPKASGFGLKNVQNRIHLYYGWQYGLTIESEPGLGTTVTVRLPRIV